MAGRPPKRVEIGVVAKAHGLRGEVVVAGCRLSPAELTAVGTVVARAKDGSESALDIVSARPFVHQALVCFRGVTDRDAADALRGRVLEADPARLPRPEEGTVYLFQLMGLAVRSLDGVSLGTVHDVWATGATPVLVVREGPAGGRERLIPMSPDVLVGVDLEEGVIDVRLLPGMETL